VLQPELFTQGACKFQNFSIAFAQPERLTEYPGFNPRFSPGGGEFRLMYYHGLSVKGDETGCFITMPIAVQACLCIRRLALHFGTGCTNAAKRMDVREWPKRSYGYAFRSRAASTNTRNGTWTYRLWSEGRNPAPASAILVRNAG
jgi:hypothetical protein